MVVKLPRIELAEAHKKALAEKHKVELQTVRNALKYFTNSELAEQIRKDAKSILIKEAKNVKIK